MDGRKHIIPVKLVNNKPIENEWECECGGTVYAAPSAKFATCSNGEHRCTRCRRRAHRFGKGLTCGLGCQPYGELNA